MCNYELFVGLVGMLFNEDNKFFFKYAFWGECMYIFIFYFGVIVVFLLCVYVVNMFSFCCFVYVFFMGCYFLKRALFFVDGNFGYLFLLLFGDWKKLDGD